MSLLPGPFSTAMFALTALLTAAQAGAAPGSDATTPAAKAAARGAVVAYNKQRQEAQQELGTDDMKRVQGIGQALLAAQAGVQASPAEEALRAEIKALHDELEQAVIVASLPRLTNGMEVTEATVTMEELPRGADVPARTKNNKTVLLEDSQVPRQAGSNRRVVHIGKEALANRDTDNYARVRARLDAMRPRVEAADATGMAADKGNPSDRRMHTAHMAKKARQLSDGVRAAVNARPSAENLRGLVELQDRLREKNLDEVLGVSSTPVTPTFTTSIQHR